MISFGGVVVNHIEDDLDSRRMQGFYHGFEIIDAVGRAVARFGSKEADRVVSPVIAQSALNQIAVVDKCVNRHQFNCGDSELGQVIYYGRGCQSSVGPAQSSRDLRMSNRKPFDVQ